MTCEKNFKTVIVARDITDASKYHPSLIIDKCPITVHSCNTLIITYDPHACDPHNYALDVN